MVGSIIDRPRHEEFKQPASREIEEVKTEVGMEIGRVARRSMARKEERANPPGSFYRKRPALVLGAIGCRATR